MFKDRIKKLRSDLGLSQSKFANYVNVSPSLVGHWELGHREPTVAMLEQLSQQLGVSLDYLVGHVDEKDETTPNKFNVMTYSVPVYGHIPAGVPLEALENELGEIPIPDWLSKKSDLFGLVISGDSMDKVLPNGVIGVFQKCSTLENGEIGAIIVNGYEATVKRFYRLTEGVLLEPQSHNIEHKPQIIDNEAVHVEVIGKLWWYSPLGEVK